MKMTEDLEKRLSEITEEDPEELKREKTLERDIARSKELSTKGMKAWTKNKRVKYYSEALELWSENIDALYHLGMEELTISFPFPGSVGADKMKERVYKQLKEEGIDMIDKSSRKKAEALFRRCIKVAPKSPLGYAGMGKIRCIDTKDYSEAEKYFKKAIEVDQAVVMPHEYLGDIYVMRDNLKKAEECYRSAARNVKGLFSMQGGHAGSQLSNFGYIKMHTEHNKPKVAKRFEGWIRRAAVMHLVLG